MKINLLKTAWKINPTVKALKAANQPPAETTPTGTTLLNALMAEVVRARNASQSALQRLRSGRVSSEEALSDLRRTRQEVQLHRQNLLRALAAHQGS